MRLTQMVSFVFFSACWLLHASSLLAQNSPAVRIRSANQTLISHGSGVIIDAQAGLILTAAHVVENSASSQITVDCFDRSFRPLCSLAASVLQTDASADLALISFPPQSQITNASLLAPNRLTSKPGDSVLSIGSTNGHFPSVLRSRLLEAGSDFTALGPEGNGRSGGGLYFEGWLIGIRRGWQPLQQLEVYTSLPQVHQFLSRCPEYKPLLLYCYSTRVPCLACQAFDQDYRSVPNFAHAISARFRLYRVDLGLAPTLSQRLQVVSLPTFLPGNQQAAVIGYESAETLLSQLNLTLPATQQPTLASQPTSPSSSLAPFCRQHVHCECALKISQLTAQLHQVQQQLTTLQTARNQSPSFGQVQQMQAELDQLMPLLHRTLVIEDQQGQVLSEKTYRPGETIRLRGIYKSRTANSPTSSH